MGKKKKGGVKKGKKPAKKTKPSKKYTKYKVEGDKLIRTGKTCPKCGSGVFLGEHQNRLSCGRCHYTEFKKKEAKPEEKK